MYKSVGQVLVLAIFISTLACQAKKSDDGMPVASQSSPVPKPTPAPVVVTPIPTPTPVVVTPIPTPTPIVVSPPPPPAPVCKAGTQRSCQINNGTGTQTCNSVGSAWESCGNLTACNSNYTLSSSACYLTNDPRVFDANWYLQNYSDLKAAFGSDTNAATNHWIKHGVNEGRQGTLMFSSPQYLSMYSDLQTAFGSKNYAAAVQHRLEFGISEGRAGLYNLRAEVFNVNWYLQNHSDIKAAFGSDTNAATNHWLIHGVNEGRQASAGFSSKNYLNRYADLRAAFGSTNYAMAIYHYIIHGIREGRNGQ